MTKFGTPIGAAPKSAMVRLGLVSVGVPSGRRSAGSVIGLRSAFVPPVSRLVVAAVVTGFGLSGRPAGAWTSKPRPPWPDGPTTPSSGVVVVVVGVVVVVDGGVVGGRRPRGGRVRGRWCAGGSASRWSPDSVESRGSEQSGSSRSVTPSPSSSTLFEHCGSAWMSPRSEPFGSWICTPLWPTPTTLPPPALAVPATTQVPRTARPIVSRSFRLIPSCFALGTGPRPGTSPCPRRQWLTLSS